MNDYDSTRHSSAGSAPESADARRFSPKKKGAWMMGAGLAAVAVIGGSGVAAAATLSPSGSTASATTTAAVTSTPTPTPTQPGGARSGPADGGATGIIESTSSSSFTISTATGIDVTVDETSATKIHGGPAKDVQKGTSVLVLGLVDATTPASTTITAAQVDVQPHGDGGVAEAAKSGVMPFDQGAPAPTKTVGTIPADYTQGEGTLVSGNTAYKAVEAAQAVFPGGIVDRVVQLADGSYEVHNISIAWPHHVFVSSNDKVTGADD